MPSAARFATLAVIFTMVAVAVFAAIDRARVGVPRATFTPENATTNVRFIVRSAPPGDALRVGDKIEIDDPASLAALQYKSLASGSVLVVRRLSPRPAAAIAERLVPARRIDLTYFLLAIQLLFLAVAAVIAARGDRNGSLQLALLLALVTSIVDPVTPAWPVWLLIAYAVAGNVIIVVAFYCAADFASRLTHDGTLRWGRPFRRVAAASALVAGLATIVGAYSGYTQPETPAAFQYGVVGALIVQAIIALVGLARAFASGNDTERLKARWVSLSIGIGATGFVVTVILNVMGIAEPLRDIPLLLLVAMPLGCAYAILRYRLLNIGFVINRATVFGITSLVVLSALALVDYGLQNLLGSWLVRSGLFVQLGLALAIGIATRPLHGRIDTFVDDLFFRERHETERALRRYARDVAHIDDPAVVLARTTETIARSSRLGCSLFLRSDREFVRSSTNGVDATAPTIVDRNDALVVRMLATRGHIDVHEVQDEPTSIAGDFAFPMFARDRLLGFIVCSGKQDGAAAYAPDEIEAIAAVATATGLALDLSRIEALEREIATLRGRQELRVPDAFAPDLL